MVDSRKCATLQILAKYKQGKISLATTKERLHQLCWQNQAADILIDWVDRDMLLFRVERLPATEAES